MTEPLPILIDGPSPHPECEWLSPTGECRCDALYWVGMTCGCNKKVCFPHLRDIGQHLDRGGKLMCPACVNSGRVGRGLGIGTVVPLRSARRDG